MNVSKFFEDHPDNELQMIFIKDNIRREYFFKKIFGEIFCYRFISNSYDIFQIIGKNISDKTLTSIIENNKKLIELKNISKTETVDVSFKKENIIRIESKFEKYFENSKTVQNVFDKMKNDGIELNRFLITNISKQFNMRRFKAHSNRNNK